MSLLSLPKNLFFHSMHLMSSKLSWLFKAFCRLFTLSFFVLIPALVFAESPFAPMATAIQTDANAILDIVGGVGVMFLGVLAFNKRLSLGMGISGVIGVICIFGHETIIGWIKSAANI